MIFNFSEGIPIIAELGSQLYNLPRCFISGFAKQPIRVRLPLQQIFFGVIFQPTAVRKVFGCPAREFADTTVDLSLVLTGFDSLWHQLRALNSFDERVAVFMQWVNTKYFECHPQDTFIDQFLYNNNLHRLSVPGLANLVCYSPRHLSRKIIEATGMNTEEVLVYKKYLHAMHLLHHTHFSLTDIAYQSQFADQSHFIRSFKTFTQMTPGEYRRNKSFVKGHLYKDVR